MKIEYVHVSILDQQTEILKINRENISERVESIAI